MNTGSYGEYPVIGYFYFSIIKSSHQLQTCTLNSKESQRELTPFKYGRSPPSEPTGNSAVAGCPLGQDHNNIQEARHWSYEPVLGCQLPLEEHCKQALTGSSVV